ncbi:16S rRNA (cytidine(1402)-2'-O)-methyltransferase [Buchnera aphidicola (Thelaxes californica)]|uniref:Ribosomal RNA small subunit methyltransferase I n=1 Tax=Buchnera aphidicola (Thelaxes californica) TaxID=1315998 RepID=A0A4D6YB58_9GAMM|nr:16S rRNA (cytidine(1402)-2'-O)-methyltransferase [Buchnera aphidicola]QCI26629.1 16S rRNA (cytidine(1402)-2'-O)-methyltransferase [Buchnera aphidicola (Thelaxes californica)]
MNINEQQGILYIVPTPIGNLSDMTYRATKILKTVDCIAAENTRHTQFLLQTYDINNKLISLHKYNEKNKTNIIINYLKNKKNIALVSNAGTPMISDPGFYLLQQCLLYQNIKIVPLPGACAIITALIASGLPTNQFIYEGFLPSSKIARIKKIQLLLNETRTTIFYESPHRLLFTLQDIQQILGKDKNIVIVKELTKIWESIIRMPVIQAIQLINNHNFILKGEIVLLIQGIIKKKKKNNNVKILHTFNILKNVLTTQKAAYYTSKIHNLKKNFLYKYIFKK